MSKVFHDELRGRDLTTEQLVFTYLDGNDYYTGAVEANSASIRKLQESYSRLLEMMMDKGLSEDDVSYIVKGYRR